ncbi:hypothetical protein [Natronococcus amylolyticus]|uniref:hypothetical protein n=1 Tax=Natronococcus amylolyticus TaxID=44470 RepID=UPI0012682352|nr:hypothetical protein [Natronococcus amylolyticus]
MERRKFLIGAGSTAIGASALVGSGAFSSASVDRGMSVNFSGDAEAYLGLEGTSQYADVEDNVLEIDFGETTTGGEGLNNQASMEFTDVFRIKNQGTNTVTAWIDLGEIDDQLDNGYVTSWVSSSWGETDYEAGLDVSSGGSGINLTPGTWIGVAIQFEDIDQDSLDTISGDVTINAAAEDSHVQEGEYDDSLTTVGE